MSKKPSNLKITYFLQYLLLIIVIFECNSVYSQIYKFHYYIRGSLIIFAIFILLYLIINKINVIKRRKNINIIIKSIIYLLICGFIMLLNSKELNGKIIAVLIIMMFSSLTLIYLLSLNKNELKIFLNKYVKIILIISSISLVFWMFGSVLHIIKPINQIKVVWGKPYTLVDNYAFIYFDSKQVQTWITNAPIPRNMSIFGEAPMYAFVIIIAMIINNYTTKNNSKSNKYANIILMLSLLSTISVTGIVSGILILLPTILNYYNSLSIKIKRIILVIIIVSAILIFPVGRKIVINKLSTSSSNARVMDLKNGFNAYIESPIIGKGINHPREYENNVKKGYGYSNVIIPILTDGGIVLTIIYLSPIIAYIILIVKYKKTNFNDIILLLVYLIILFTTAVQYRMLLIMFICVLYYNYIIKLRDKSKV